MTDRIPRFHALFGAVLVILLLVSCERGPEAPTERPTGARPPLTVTEELITSGPQELSQVRHLVLRGTNRQIGAHLAQIARERYRIRLPQLAEGKAESVWQFFGHEYPQHQERMEGVAEVFGREDQGADYSVLQYGPGFRVGCSAVFCPGGFTESGTALLSRSFDYPVFSTAAIMEKPVISQPYVVEMYPDSGYSSLYLCSFDLLGGVLDGVNSEGLAISVLSDSDASHAGRKPSRETLEGLNELQMPRYLLDTCATVEEAEQALRRLPNYCRYEPVHYIVADRNGKSFVCDYVSTSPQAQITWNNENPQVVTNFQLCRYKSIQALPKGSPHGSPVWRYLELFSSLSKSAEGVYSLEMLKAMNRKVFAGPSYGGTDSSEAVRTLWHSIYDLEERKLFVSFYLGEGAVQEEGRPAEKRSEYFSFQLKNGPGQN